MAASAEYELEKRVEKLDLFPVELEKGVDTQIHKHVLTITDSLSQAAYVTTHTYKLRITKSVLLVDIHCLSANNSIIP